jgi:hypothetical protein
MYKSLLGLECPGCGMQRSFIEILKGEFLNSLALYPALLPSMLLIALLIIHLIFKLERGAAMLKILFLMNALIIVLHYIYRILT